MGTEEYKEVFQTNEYQEANLKLKEGYRIIKIFSSKTQITEQGDMAVLPMYVLGKK